ncbi:M24 family metallopeptidase [Azohydromonas lata]|uniref:M24 family metallopeptidase n=1 Tax=Azohydromonas lata TaxID=45677 RepID=A0ABU5IAG3_9BURK|nr:M24 family metallopeptidase [Azohydromonas lata]MDZ5456094.1 M24 family metallopeptidase [Azohydromonas lata]
MDMPSTIRLRNGEPAWKTFSKEEYARRIATLRAQLVAENIDAALFSSYHNVAYYSDFLYCSFGRFYGLAVTHAKTTVIAANIDGAQPWRKSVADDVLTYTDWQRGNFFRAAAQCLPARGRIGVELDHLPVDRLQALRDALPGVEFVDISAACMRLRMVKSAEEIEFIAAGAQVCDVGGAALVAAVKEGVPEHEVALASTTAMVREIARRYPGAELMDTWTWFQSGLNTDGAHNPVTTRRVQKGDILSLNCFSMISGYYTALERTLFLDHASDAHLKLWEINCKVHDEGKKLLVPGARCSDIAHQLNEIYLEHDLLQYRTFGYGHSFGVLSHYYGREAGLELREDIDTVLQPNMVVSMEPMIMLPEGLPGAGGYREHDILVITPEGNRNLTGFPYGPAHNIIKA